MKKKKNIAAIDCVDLVTFSDPKVELIGKANDTERSTTYKTHIAFNWTLPNININNFGAEGHCLKNAADGNVCSRDSGGDTGLLYKVSVLGYGASYDQWFFDGCDRVCTGRYPESEQADFVSAVTGVSCNCCLLFFYDDLNQW